MSLIGMVGSMILMRFGELVEGRRLGSLLQETRIGRTGVPLVFKEMGDGAGFMDGGGDSIFRLTGLDNLAPCAR